MIECAEKNPEELNCEFSCAIVSGWSGRGCTSVFVSFDPAQLAGEGNFQLADVSGSIAAADHEAEPAGACFVAAAALRGDLPAGFCFRAAIFAETDGSDSGDG